MHPLRFCPRKQLLCSTNAEDPRRSGDYILLTNFRFPCYNGLGTLYLSTGEISKAESYLAQGQEICEKTGYTPDALIMLPFLC